MGFWTNLAIKAGLIDPAQDAYLSWADRVLDLQAEREAMARKRARDGGPGSGRYEAWHRDWMSRMSALVRARPGQKGG